MAEQEDRTFFKRLQKLFSTNVIVRVDKDGKRKVVDTDERQRDSNLVSLRDRYTKLQRSFYEQQGGAQSMAYQQVRRELFRDYDAMDNDPIIASALDIYSDEATTKNEYGDVLSINSQNQNVKELLENLFYDILNIEYNLWSWTRNLVKYGDFFLQLEIEPEKGIINAMPVSVYEIERIEGFDPTNPSYVKFKIENDPLAKGEYENYEIAHFRLKGDTNFLPYGKAMIENTRRIWKQLSLMEDAMMIHRIMRAPEKRIFKIDIGNISPNEVDNYMQKIISKMKKVPFVDTRTGEYNLKYNIQNITEDFFLPVRGSDSGTGIESLSGLDYSATEDIEFLQKKLFASLKVPKAFLGYEEQINGKATLAAEDVRFARTVERIQRMLEGELAKIAIVHLSAQGINDFEMVNFDLKLTNPSTIYEQEKINLWSEKVRLARDIQDLNMLSKDFVYEQLFNLSKDESDEQRVKIINDLKDKYRYEQISMEGNDPAVQKEKVDVEEELKTIKTELTKQRSNLKDKGGRPREGNTYKKDKHPYGRDPIGDGERTKPRKRELHSEKRNARDMVRQYINGISSKRKVINEKKTFMDDENIINE
jgi:hypothetical protein